MLRRIPVEREGVLVIGSANMDMAVYTERFPAPGETVLGKQFAMFPGGKGTNQAVCCAKLGSRTLFIGKMGNDLFRERLCGSMERNGVNLEHLLIDPDEPTGVALITVDGRGQNQIVVASGSNMKLSPADIEEKRALFSAVKIVLAQLESPLETVMAAARLANENGCIFILNPAPAAPLPLELLQQVDFLTPNETELEMISGMAAADPESAAKAARSLLNRGIGHVIVTLGERGALLVDQSMEKLFPARKVAVVDSTAAGDAFNGALAHSLASGAGLNEAIEFANAVGSFSVTRKGAQSAMPSPEEIDAFIRNNPGVKGMGQGV
ncbi:MAG: ribokinase [Calditrichaceae bacterium]|nr:ribokinase [Calditrichaceae bacterium]